MEGNIGLAELTREVKLIAKGIILRPVWARCESEQDATERYGEAMADGDIEAGARCGIESAWFFGVGKFLREWRPTGRAA
jgi:hypothetical protein